MDEQTLMILIDYMPCFMLNKLTSYHALEVTIVFLKAQFNVARYVMGSVSQSHVTSLIVFVIFIVKISL